MNRQRIHNILGDAFLKRILVVGDVMLDEFVWGRVSRISPEAPVPVVEVSSQTSYPGGAANVARNLIEFTPNVRVLGAVGADAHAVQLSDLLKGEGIQTDCIVELDDFSTIVKTRIIARHQQVVRVDRERRCVLTDSKLEQVLRLVREVMPETDAIIFEDYGKGFINQPLKDAVTDLAKSHGVLVTVDPNPKSTLDWAGASAIKPNRSEAFAAAGISDDGPTDDPGTDGPLLEVGRRLIEMWKVDQLLITLGEHGMMLFDGGEAPYHTPTRAQEVFDVSGAGDTAIALYTLALASGATPREAAETANHASGIVVGKLGTATVTPDELLSSFED